MRPLPYALLRPNPQPSEIKSNSSWRPTLYTFLHALSLHTYIAPDPRILSRANDATDTRALWYPMQSHPLTSDERDEYLRVLRTEEGGHPGADVLPGGTVRDPLPGGAVRDPFPVRVERPREGDAGSALVTVAVGRGDAPPFQRRVERVVEFMDYGCAVKISVVSENTFKHAFGFNSVLT